MKKSILRSLITFLYIAITPQIAFTQANPNPCSFPGVKCQNGGGNGIVNSFGSKSFDYPCPGRSMPFWFAFGDTITNAIDTSMDAKFAISGVYGPGTINGKIDTEIGKYCFLNNVDFTVVGVYDIRITMMRGGLTQQWLKFNVVPEEDFCSEAPSGKCSNIKGNKIFAKGPNGNVITVDAVFPVIVAVIDSVSGNIDTTFSGTIYASKLTGPGMLYGTLSMSGVKWFNFTNLRFSTDGYYTIKFYEQDPNKYKEAIVQVIVTSTTGIAEIKTEDILTFPNPFSDHLNISLDEKTNLISYHIYDQTGRLVLQKLNEKLGDHFTIDTQNLDKGFYILNIIANQNQEIKNIVIVKQ